MASADSSASFTPRRRGVTRRLSFFSERRGGLPG